MIIVLTVIVTLIFTVILFNLKSPGKRIEHIIVPCGDLNSSSVQKSIGELLGPPLVSGNKVTHLCNGDEIFKAMLESIQAAKISITFETFIYWSGEISKELAAALCERAKKGVAVHIILDWLGSNKIDQSTLEEMKDSGIQVEQYHPIRWYNVTRINNRTHRKILVVDGKIGFTGGVGIADQWRGHAEDKEHWRDSHFKVEGPVVSQLQAAFMDNWNSTNPHVLHGENYFPFLKDCGQSLAQVFKSSPEEGSGSVRLMYLYSIVHAKKSIRIANAYFVPDSHVIKLLIDAAKKGVAIEVIVPGKFIDTKMARKASMNTWGDLLRAGIKIYEYTPTMFHCKYMIVDDLWVSVGSTNLDNRSFRLNDECNLNIIDQAWATELAATFAKDRAASVEMTYDVWLARPLVIKVLEKLSFLFRSQL